MVSPLLDREVLINTPTVLEGIATDLLSVVWIVLSGTGILSNLTILEPEVTLTELADTVLRRTVQDGLDIVVDEVTLTGVEELVEEIPPSDRVSWLRLGMKLRRTGYEGSTNDVIYEWLLSKGFTGQINEAFYNYLGSLNYEGTFTERYGSWASE
jgi:hypothetical protein